MTRVTEANLDGHRAGFIAGYMEVYQKEFEWMTDPNEAGATEAADAYIHSLVFDDTKPCTCGGKQDGLHSRICEHRRI